METVLPVGTIIQIPEGPDGEEFTVELEVPVWVLSHERKLWYVQCLPELGAYQDALEHCQSARLGERPKPAWWQRGDVVIGSVVIGVAVGAVVGGAILANR